MRNTLFKVACTLGLYAMHGVLFAQMPVPQTTEGNVTPKVGEPRAELQRKIQGLTAALSETHEQLERSQHQVELLQAELLEIQRQVNLEQQLQPTDSSSKANEESTEAKIADLSEQQEILKEQVKLQNQTKVESVSKYPVRLTGLILFNAFANDGVVDNLDLPEVALRPTPGISHAAVGAGMRQTIFGLQALGPKIAGAKTFADLSLDFFAGLSYGNFGTSAGTVRMRTASVNMEWQNDFLQVGMVGPLISPLSPTSYATVAQPGMAWAGNLWTWAPQVRYQHRFVMTQGRTIGLEAGLWDTPGAGFSQSELVRQPTPGELAKRPAYEARVSFGGNAGEHKFDVGLGGYYNRQSYPNDKTLDTWAATLDFTVPFGSRFEVTGEAYRGLGLGGLGGGVYKDVVTGTDPVTGLSAMRGLNTIGGWTQFKTRFSQTIEANGAIGQDTGFAGDFHALVLPANAGNSALRARNRAVVANVIFRPKTYFIVSPEYRRIWTWPINSSVSTANIYTISLGYEF
jgi:hypothetical protein